MKLPAIKDGRLGDTVFIDFMMIKQHRPFVCLLLFNPFSLRASQIFRVNRVFFRWHQPAELAGFVFPILISAFCLFASEGYFLPTVPGKSWTNHNKPWNYNVPTCPNFIEFRHNCFWIQVFSIFGQIVSMLGRLNDWITIFAGSQGATALSALGALKRRQQWQEALALLEEHDQHGGTVAVSATKGWSKRLGILYPMVKATINCYKSG